jgi:TRAP-type C4-dicarboxylate transport system permease large subunit
LLIILFILGIPVCVSIEFTAIILFIISIAGLYGWLLVRLQIPLTLAESVIKLTTNPKLLLVVLMVFF